MQPEAWTLLLLFASHPLVGDERFDDEFHHFHDERRNNWKIEENEAGYLANTFQRVIQNLIRIDDQDMVDDAGNIRIIFDCSDEMLEWSGYTAGISAIEYVQSFCAGGAFVLERIEKRFGLPTVVHEIGEQECAAQPDFRPAAHGHGLAMEQFVFYSLPGQPGKKWVGKYIKFTLGPGYGSLYGLPIIVRLVALERSVFGDLCFVTRPAFSGMGHAKLYLKRFSSTADKRIETIEEAVPVGSSPVS